MGLLGSTVNPGIHLIPASISRHQVYHPGSVLPLEEACPNCLPALRLSSPFLHLALSARLQLQPHPFQVFLLQLPLPSSSCPGFLAPGTSSSPSGNSLCQLFHSPPVPGKTASCLPGETDVTCLDMLALTRQKELLLRS